MWHGSVVEFRAEVDEIRRDDEGATVAGRCDRAQVLWGEARIKRINRERKQRNK